MSVKHVHDRDFQSVVLQSELPVLVDFWAPWCGPCRSMSGVVDELARDLEGTALVVKVNVDEAAEIAGQYGVNSIPTFAVVHDGQVVERVTGAVPKSRLLKALAPHLPSAA